MLRNNCKFTYYVTLLEDSREKRSYSSVVTLSHDSDQFTRFFVCSQCPAYTVDIIARLERSVMTDPCSKKLNKLLDTFVDTELSRLENKFRVGRMFILLVDASESYIT